MTKMTGQTIIICACIVGAAAVAYSGNDGWGWIVAIAILAML